MDWDDIDRQNRRPEPQLEDDVDYVDEILHEESDNYEQGYTEDNPIVNEALRRIEQAKLYESLIRHDFFAPGSARPDIQEKVTAEIRSFILERLSQLVGILPETKAPIAAQPVELPWDSAQIEALTSLATRLVEKTSASAAPTPRVSSEPVVKVFDSKPAATAPRVLPAKQAPVPRTAPPPTRPNAQRAPAPQPKPKIEKLPDGVTIDPATGNPVTSDGITLYKGQVRNKQRKTLKMPSQKEIDRLNNDLALKNSAGNAGYRIAGDAVFNKHEDE
jgi:hypothetical protein